MVTDTQHNDTKFCLYCGKAEEKETKNMNQIYAMEFSCIHAMVKAYIKISPNETALQK